MTSSIRFEVVQNRLQDVKGAGREAKMPVLPIPMIIALVLFGLLMQRALTNTMHPTLLTLIGICAVQSAVIALVHYYGLAAMRPVQPLLATLIAPVAWVAFSQAARDPIRMKHLWLHGAGLAAAVLCLITNPMWLDILIPLSFAGYGAVMLAFLAQGEDSLPHSRLESGSAALWAWRIVALSLLASAACDVLISYSLAMGRQGVVLWIPSLVSSLSLLSLGALGLSNAIESRRDGYRDDRSSSAADDQMDQEIIARLDEYVAARKPYLDPDLTLARLARKVQLPAKQLSAAINRVKQENVSRYINRLRIEHACRLLSGGHSVTTAMLESGFNTKSNFNREFLRVMATSPSLWARSNRRAAERSEHA